MLYSPVDPLSDYICILHPFIEIDQMSYGHQTLRVAAPGLDVASENGVRGSGIFGGSELTFASVPQGVGSICGGALGYRKYPTPFTGFETKPLSLSLAGHC